MKTSALLLIAHGSRQPEANADLLHLADCLRQRGYPIVEPAFLELAEPNIAEAARRCVAAGCRQVVMLPYFLSAGVHVQRDLTAAREELSLAHPHVNFLLAEPLGRHPLLIEIIADRIAQAHLAPGESPGAK